MSTGKSNRSALWRDNIRRYARWLVPGLGVKRWLLLVLFGTTLMGIGLAVLVLDVYRTAPDTWWLPVLSTVSLRFLPRLVRVVVFGLAGTSLILAAIWGLNRSLLSPYRRSGKPVLDELASHRRREKGPRVARLAVHHRWLL